MVSYLRRAGAERRGSTCPRHPDAAIPCATCAAPCVFRLLPVRRPVAVGLRHHGLPRPISTQFPRRGLHGSRLRRPKGLPRQPELWTIAPNNRASTCAGFIRDPSAPSASDFMNPHPDPDPPREIRLGPIPRSTITNRPLNARGQRNAPRIGAWLAGQGMVPDAVPLLHRAQDAPGPGEGIATALPDTPEPVFSQRPSTMRRPETCSTAIRDSDAARLAPVVWP